MCGYFTEKQFCKIYWFVKFCHVVTDNSRMLHVEEMSLMIKLGEE
jgi:hypothetical protein